MHLPPTCRNMFFAAVAVAGTSAVGDDTDLEFFEKRIRPILVEQCHQCHSDGAKKLKGGLRLDSRAAALAGGDSGPAIVPGKPEESRFVTAVRYSDVDLRMPPKGKLSDDQIAALTEWVRRGAAWPKQDAVRTAATGKEAFDLEKRKAAHWAWQPVRPPGPPPVKNTEWAHDAIDRFVLARLEEKNLPPAPSADRRTLIRRLYFDLIGLPPTPHEVDSFLGDSSPYAFERVVDRLLASPHFGERWARHWLDLVRYGETRGHEFDPVIPNAYQYRDYCIRALNAEVPYDQFVSEHIAGDLMAPPRLHASAGFNESVLGTGFWFLGEEVHSPVDIRQDETDRMDNRLDVMGKTFLGLTVGCARCHDHKFDAISQRDYYALMGFLISSGYRQVRFETMEQERRIAAELDRMRASARADVLRLVAEDERPGMGRMADYLLAARDAIVSRSQGEHKGVGNRLPERLGGCCAQTIPDPFLLTAIAQARRLDPTLLGRWVEELAAASQDNGHPLHPFALVAHAPDADDAALMVQLLKPMLVDWQNRAAKVATSLASCQVVADYSSADAADAGLWHSDGVAFGLRAVRPGEVQFIAGGDRAPLRVFDYGAAQRDPTWNVLRLAPGVERDHGTLGAWDRSGQTLRTPEFTVAAGNVCYLVKGSCRAYAAVNSHLVIAGPLHGALLLEPKGDGQWRWVQHNLAAYKGHRVHIEFSPVGGDDFGLAMVVQSDGMPLLPGPPVELLAAMLSKGEIRSPQALAEAYQRLLLNVLDRMERDQIAGSSDAAAHAHLADWLVQKLDLFGSLDTNGQSRAAAACEQLLAKQLELVQQVQAESHTAPAMLDGNGVDEHLLIRGSSKTPAAPVQRRFLEAIAGTPSPSSGSGRLELARHMTDPANPLVSRVMVNRIWHHLFGQGIVPTVDNFGVLGQPPTHPELLDYLAEQFVRDGWSVKRLIRRLVLTRTYQMTSDPREPGESQDPDNHLLHRQRMRRLEGEVIRDCVLAVTGRLDRTLFGPSVPVHLTPFMEGRGRPQDSGPLDGNGRRSIYIAVRRNFLSPMMLAFDTPAPFSTMGRRTVSNVPAQALILMNDPFVVDQAQLLATRLLADRSLTPQQRIGSLYQVAVGRPPSDSELSDAWKFIDDQAARYGIPNEQRALTVDAWKDLCHVMFNVKEFIFVH